MIFVKQRTVLEEFVVRTRVIFQSGSDKMDITRFILKRKMQMRFFVRMKEKQLHGEELTKEDRKRAVKDEAYRKKLLEELNSQG